MHASRHRFKPRGLVNGLLSDTTNTVQDALNGVKDATDNAVEGLDSIAQDSKPSSAEEPSPKPTSTDNLLGDALKVVDNAASDVQEVVKTAVEDVKTIVSHVVDAATTLIQVEPTSRSSTARPAATKAPETTSKGLLGGIGDGLGTVRCSLRFSPRLLNAQLDCICRSWRRRPFSALYHDWKSSGQDSHHQVAGAFDYHWRAAHNT
jgi:hypothetical protein